MILAVALLGFEPALALSLSVYLHLGTGLAAMFYFRKDLKRIILRNSEDDIQLFRFFLLATITTGVVGFPIFLFVKLSASTGETILVLTGLALIATGLIQKRNCRTATKKGMLPNSKDSIILGALQGFSVIPGLSRSGITTSVLLFEGYSGEDAFRLSFIMSIPASFAAVLGLGLFEGAPSVDTNLLIAIGASIFSSLFSINLLLKVAKKVQFWSLCILLGLIAIIPVIPYFLGVL